MADKPPVSPAESVDPQPADKSSVVSRPVPGGQLPPSGAPASQCGSASHGHVAAISHHNSLSRSDASRAARRMEGGLLRSLLVLFNLRVLPGWMTSALLHMAGILILALLYLPVLPSDTFQEIFLTRDDQVDELEELVEEVIEPTDMEMVTDEVVTTVSPSMEVLDQVTNISTNDDVEAALINVELSDYSETTAPRSDMLAVVGSYTGTGFEGRGQAARAGMLRAAGGTKESEEAVSRSLKWFSKHQLYDGGWSFDHRLGPCQSRCENPGTLKDARIGATAMALLPFLGAGQTHQEGSYKDQVRRGLYFLVNSMEIKENDLGDLWEPGGQMYSHALATIVLCEAYGMSQDPELVQPAQMAVNYLMWAQNKNDGGWRYTADDLVGDTSVVGWVLMALKSAHMAYHLEVREQTISGAVNFFDTVQKDNGSKYSYVAPAAPQPAVTAIGLLCRMYLGWEKGHVALQQGVDYLAEIGPLQQDFYFKYYATQVMRHIGGERWVSWNEVMREHLIATQADQGHERGSWHMADNHGASGGRHYCTSMATMILEVYYRHMPVYGARALEEEFPL